MQQTANLISNEEPVLFSTESYGGKKDVYITPTKIITKSDSESRAVLLSDVKFIHTDKLHGKSKNGVILICILSFLSAILISLLAMIPSGITTLSVLFFLLSFVLIVFGIYQIDVYFDYDWDAPDTYWLNIRGTEGAIGFKIAEENIPAVINSLDGKIGETESVEYTGEIN